MSIYSEVWKLSLRFPLVDLTWLGLIFHLLSSFLPLQRKWLTQIQEYVFSQLARQLCSVPLSAKLYPIHRRACHTNRQPHTYKKRFQEIIKPDNMWKGCFQGGRTKCQPDKMPTEQNANLGWHFVRDFFSVVGILSGSTFWLAFCPDHLKMSWHPPPTSESGGPVTSFCLLLTVVGKKVDNFFLSGWLGKNTAVFYHHHLRCITPTSLTFCR